MSDLPAIRGGDPLFPDGPPSWPVVEPGVAAALQEAASDGSWGRYNGSHSEGLREELRVWSGCEQVELCASGTAASELALRAFKVGPGDEVILAAYDYAASFKNVLMLGATPVLVDVNPTDYSIRVDQIETAITNATAAIVVSHLHGGVADMPAIMTLADRHGVPVLEDACQATGGALDEHRLGSSGTLGILSFGGSKLITAGRGGAILGRDEQLFQRMHLHSFRGNTAYPLSELQAAVLRPQLAVLEERNQHRSQRVAQLKAALSDVEHLTVVHSDLTGVAPAYYKVGILLAEDCGIARDDFSAATRAEGIACDRSLHGLHKVHSRRRYRAAAELTGADLAHDHALQLHHPILLATESDIETVARGFRRILNAV